MPASTYNGQQSRIPVPRGAGANAGKSRIPQPAPANGHAGQTQQPQRGIVRDFFDERRQMQKKQLAVPSINTHFRQKQQEAAKVQQLHNYQPVKKRSAGRDRQYPLEPIADNGSGPSKTAANGRQYTNGTVGSGRNVIGGNNYTENTPPNMDKLKQIREQKLRERNQRQQNQQNKISPAHTYTEGSPKSQTSGSGPTRQPVHQRPQQQRQSQQRPPATRPPATRSLQQRPQWQGGQSSDEEDERDPLLMTGPVPGPPSYKMPKDEMEVANGPLVACKICGRKFAKDRLAKHQDVCKKATEKLKKRKVFDPVKMRTEGTEAEKYVRSSKKKKEPPQKKVDWRKQHDEFIRAIRDAKKVSQHIAAGGKVSDLPPPPPSENPDYVQCPHCKRKFNETAAERHIPKCKDIGGKQAPQAKRGPNLQRRAR